MEPPFYKADLSVEWMSQKRSNNGLCYNTQKVHCFTFLQPTSIWHNSPDSFPKNNAQLGQQLEKIRLKTLAWAAALEKNKKSGAFGVRAF